ncbi:MAG: hypothetical protein N6V49_02850 [Serratia symbiotica]|nr:hypothetical protein [Serratia symbiotica]
MQTPWRREKRGKSAVIIPCSVPLWHPVSRTMADYCLRLLL